MKQIRFESFGQPSRVVNIVDVPQIATPAAWEIVVDIEAFPIHFADLAMLSGKYGKLPKLPATIGMEAVGKVSQCGSQVKEIAPGDRVIIVANDNWAQQRKVPVAAVHKIPDSISIEQAALLKVNPATAYLLLNHFVELQSGDWIIQNAPLSSVGSCVIQLARARGIRTINVVRRADQIPQVLELGGDIVIEDRPDLASRITTARNAPVRLALDAVAGSGVQRMAECLSEGSKIVNYGMLSGEPCQLSADQTIFRGISLHGFWLSKTLNRLSLVERKTLFETLTQLMLDGKLQMQVDSTYPFSQIATALRHAEQGQRKGKILVRVDSESQK